MSNQPGSTNSQQTVSERMSCVIAALDQYEETLGLAQHNPPVSAEELQEYLNYDRDTLEKLAPETCISIAIRLSQAAFFMQREINREHARASWAKNQLDDAVSPKLNQYDKYMKHDAKIAAIAAEDNHVKKVLDIIRYSELRTQRLNFLASSLNNLSNLLESLKRLKTPYRRYGDSSDGGSG